MKNYIVYQADGLIVRSGTCQDEIISLPTNESETLAFTDSYFDFKEYYIKDKEIKTLPLKPNGEFVFNTELETWVGDDQAQTKIIKLQRDALLSSTDWTQLPDVPETLKVKWQNYRQALRDIPEQEGFPWNIIWPTKPGE